MRFHRPFLFAGLFILSAIGIAGSQGINNPGVSSLSVVTANGISGSVATPTSTPAITLTLGAITPSSVTTSVLLNAVGSSAPVARFQRNTASTNALTTVTNKLAVSTGSMADGFGGFTNYILMDTDAVENVAAQISWVRNGADNSGDLFFSTANAGTVAEKMRIGTTGVITLNTTNYNTCSALTTTAAVLTCTVSSLRFKIPGEVAPDTETVKKFLDLTPVAFTYKDPKVHGAGEHIGLYAEDVCAVDERLCVRDPDGQVTSYEDRGVLSLLIATVKQQQAQIDELRQRLK